MTETNTYNFLTHLNQNIVIYSKWKAVYNRTQKEPGPIFPTQVVSGYFTVHKSHLTVHHYTNLHVHLTCLLCSTDRPMSQTTRLTRKICSSPRMKRHSLMSFLAFQESPPSCFVHIRLEMIPDKPVSSLRFLVISLARSLSRL